MGIARKLIWSGLGTVCVVATIIAFAPASWLGLALEKQTSGRLALGDVDGSVWNGSAFIGVASSKNDDLTPLLPGRFSWRLSPILLLGQIDLELDNSASLVKPLQIDGNLHQVQISPGGVILPSERLSALGAPLNTLRPEGKITLSWDELELVIENDEVDLNGKVTLTMHDMASALSPVKPLGSYLMTFLWHGQQADMDLTTTKGPMLLRGKGALVRGRLQFTGQAEAQADYEEKLGNLLNLLGQRQPGVDKNVIALEFK